MTRTGTFATKEELEKIKKDWKKALDTPVMTFSIGAPDMAAVARRNVNKTIDALAIQHGLPSVSKFYSFDLNTGEFLLAEEKDLEEKEN